MATPRERLAAALNFLKALQDKGLVGIHTDEIPNRTYREILLKNGFIREVTKGWYIPADPSAQPGETTSWYSAYWDFLARFLHHKFGESWCLSADQSLLIHAGNNTVPQQLMLRSPLGNNSPTPLPHHTSLFNLRATIPDGEQTIIKNGMRIYDLPSSLIYSTPAVYKKNPIDARTALALIRDASEVLPILLEHGHTTFAGRLAGAFRNMNRDLIADQIIDTFKQADYDIREEDPFDTRLTISLSSRERSPYANRIRLMWEQLREVVLAGFPSAPGLPPDPRAYIKDMEDNYVTDAYHSLSIERYRVSPELIDRVSSGQWNSKENEDDRQQRNAMAARGYYQSFLQVRDTITAILMGANAGNQVGKDHSKWYRQLFDPSVVAGLLKTTDLAGYRNHQVYIAQSKNVPLNPEAVRDTMPVLFDLLEEEPAPSVRAVLGHFIFVFIHPYMDGNGRIGRFLMNTMLASGGYPWTIIPVERRDEYMQALEQASVGQDITAFVSLLSYLVNERLQGKITAKLPEEK